MIDYDKYIEYLTIPIIIFSKLGNPFLSIVEVIGAAFT